MSKKKKNNILVKVIAILAVIALIITALLPVLMYL